MQLKSILNRVEKYKSFVYEKEWWDEDPKRPSLKIPVRVRANSHPLCSGCGKPAPGHDRLPPREFEFVPLRRVECRSCGVRGHSARIETLIV